MIIAKCPKCSRLPKIDEGKYIKMIYCPNSCPVLNGEKYSPKSKLYNYYSYIEIEDLEIDNNTLYKMWNEGIKTYIKNISRYVNPYVAIKK